MFDEELIGILYSVPDVSFRFYQKLVLPTILRGFPDHYKMHAYTATYICHVLIMLLIFRYIPSFLSAIIMIAISYVSWLESCGLGFIILTFWSIISGHLRTRKGITYDSLFQTPAYNFGFGY